MKKELKSGILSADGRPPVGRVNVIAVLTYFDHGVQRKMISVGIFFVFLRLLFFALLLLFVT